MEAPCAESNPSSYGNLLSYRPPPSPPAKTDAATIPGVCRPPNGLRIDCVALFQRLQVADLRVIQGATTSHNQDYLSIQDNGNGHAGYRNLFDANKAKTPAQSSESDHRPPSTPRHASGTSSPPKSSPQSQSNKQLPDSASFNAESSEPRPVERDRNN